MPSNNKSEKKLYYIAPENLAELRKRAPRTGHQGGGSPNVNFPLNSILQRYAGLCANALARVWAAIPDPQDQAFIRHVLMSIVTDDLTAAENPITYLQEIEEVAADYSEGSEEGDELRLCPFTGALVPALRRFGPMEALALVDWIEQEKLKK